jgi:glycosyltransferase involved in cell wall biosynthesis
LTGVLRRYPRVRVSFLGTSRESAQVLADYASALHPRIEVIPHYANRELPMLLAGHSVQLFPTLSEGFGIGLIEAMACGLAPVATAAPGPLEIIRDGESGLLVPLRDAQAMEDALEHLVVDRVLLDRLRRNAHARAQRYSWRRIAQETLQLYEEGLKNRAVRGQGR